ncbi:MAG: 6-bladed beta-propeller [Gemmatimonadota bacterium]
MPARCQGIAAVATLLALASCGSPKLSPDETVEWQAHPIYEVGAAGAGSVEFGSVSSILLGPDGALYVVDQWKSAISVFDTTGRFVRNIGRVGAGPGEYRDPYSIAWMGKSLALLDPRNARLGLFDSAGNWVTSWPAPGISGGQVIRLYRTPPTAWLFAPGHDAFSGTFVQYSATGSRASTRVLTLDEPPSQGRRCVRPDSGTNYFSQPFGATLLQIPAGGTIRALALTSAYRIAIVGALGDTLRVISRDTPLAPITDSEWTAANSDWVKFRQEWPTATCDVGEFSRPSAKPPLVHLFIDDVGRLWVERATPTGPRYDIFSTTGILVATVTGLPSSEGIDPTVAGDRIAFVGHDSTDNPMVRVYRVATGVQKQ